MSLTVDIVIRDLHRFMDDQEREEREAERKELGLPHPCMDCDLRCWPRCRFYNERGMVNGK